MSNIIQEWLNENPNLKADRFVEVNLRIVEAIRLELNSRKMSVVDLAEIMKVRSTDVQRMVTGLYNLTLKDIIAFEIALKIKLL